jgi:hypothetical protein
MAALENLQAAYVTVTEKIAEVLANPLGSYTVDGVTVDRGAYYESLMRQEEALRKIPGVAPTTNPIFEVHADPSWCG